MNVRAVGRFPLFHDVRALSHSPLDYSSRLLRVEFLVYFDAGGRDVMPVAAAAGVTASACRLRAVARHRATVAGRSGEVIKTRCAKLYRNRNISERGE